MFSGDRRSNNSGFLTAFLDNIVVHQKRGVALHITKTHLLLFCEKKMVFDFRTSQGGKRYHFFVRCARIIVVRSVLIRGRNIVKQIVDRERRSSFSLMLFFFCRKQQISWNFRWLIITSRGFQYILVNFIIIIGLEF